jgi:hypothetical protein
MCFSATASFAGSAALTIIGLAALHRNKKPERRLFASIPLVFGVQQAAEGVVWLTLPSAGHSLIERLAAYFFIITAVIIWPTMVPLAVLLAERSRALWRRWLQWILLGEGIAVSAIYGVGLLTYPVKTAIQQSHVLYAVDAAPWYAGIVATAYLVATILPFFVAGNRKMFLFGGVVAVAYLVTYIAFTDFLVSVWCFFAALASAVIWWIVGDQQAAVQTGPVQTADQP